MTAQEQQTMSKQPVFNYALAHAGKTLIWEFLNKYLIFYGIYLLGFSPLEAAIISALFIVLDILLDPAVAILIQKKYTRDNDMSFWVTIMAPFCCCMFAFIFQNLNIFTLSYSLLIFLTLGVIFRATFSFIDIPLNSSIGRFESKSRGRNVMSGIRSISGMSAKLLIAVFTALIIEEKGILEAANMSYAAIIISVLALLLIVPNFKVLDKYSAGIDRTSISNTEAFKLSDIKGNITTNLKCLIALNILFLIFTPQLGLGLIFIVSNVEHAAPNYSLILVLLTITSLCTVFIWSILASLTEKKVACIISLVMFGLSSLSFLSLHQNYWGFIFFIILTGSLGHTNMMIWSMLADVIDECSVSSGKSMHAIITGLYASIGKAAIGLSQILSAILLQYFQFPQNPQIEPYIASLSWISSLGCFLAVIPLFLYKLSHKIQEGLAKELYMNCETHEF